MPKRARVFLVEDDEFQRAAVKRILESGNHQVVLESGVFEDALEKVKEVKGLRVDVAILDGSLRPRSPDDGRQIAEALRKEAPDVNIIALAGLKADWGDVNLQKPFLQEHLEVIADL